MESVKKDLKKKIEEFDWQREFLGIEKSEEAWRSHARFYCLGAGISISRFCREYKKWLES